MKIAIVVVRILMGLLFLFASVSVLFNLVPQPELTGKTKTFMDGILATGYMLTLIKVTELICGLMFVSGYFVPLATVVIAPVIVNILLFHIFVDTAGLPAAIFLTAANAFVAYGYRDKYAPLFEPR